MIIWGGISIGEYGSTPVACIGHRSGYVNLNYGQSINNDNATEIHYDQYAEAHSVKFITVEDARRW